MKRRKLIIKSGLLLAVFLLSVYVGSAKIWYCTDQCCMEYPNNVCEYHYDDGSYACSFDGIPVNQLD